MTNVIEFILMIDRASGLIFLAVIMYGIVHSGLASQTMKTLVQRYFGALGDRAYRLAYNLIAVLTLIPVLALFETLPDGILYQIPFPWVFLTTFIQALASLMLVVGVLQTGVWSFLGIQQVFQPERNDPSVLVVGGLYSWVRHPLYTSALVLIWLSPRMTVNLLALNTGMTIYILIGIFLEERKLLHEFGAAYLHYRERTSMLIPYPKSRG